MIDYATRYPEAVALPSIETERVAEALVEMFSRVGIPDEMLTDCGSQFTAEVMKEVSRLLSLQQLTTTPYHPMCNGLVERFHATMKQMLRRMCAERPKDWDKYLPALLFAIREVPQESLGFSPYGVEFLLETDHKPQSYLQTAKVLNPRIMRWAMRLQPYRFRIIAIRGQDNLGADYLSR